MIKGTPINRLALAAVVGVVVTFVVFWGMQALVGVGGSVERDMEAQRIPDFIDMSRDSDVQTDQRKPKKPPAPPEEPPQPDMPQPSLDSTVNPASAFDISGVGVDAEMSVDAGLSGAGGDGDFLPIVKVAPVYPRRAAQKGIEGYVVVEYTVNAQGAVENPVVIEADPPGIFNRAATQSALKYKYKPRIVDGKPQPVPGVRTIIRFELDKSTR
ncbi:TonB family protein [gamma proteobacterium HTCC5015]|nr:TonB family protein [gamma proteobacterium HTCC5015]